MQRNYATSIFHEHKQMGGGDESVYQSMKSNNHIGGVKKFHENIPGDKPRIDSSEGEGKQGSVKSQGIKKAVNSQKKNYFVKGEYQMKLECDPVKEGQIPSHEVKTQARGKKRQDLEPQKPAETWDFKEDMKAGKTPSREAESTTERSTGAVDQVIQERGLRDIKKWKGEDRGRRFRKKYFNGVSVQGASPHQPCQMPKRVPG